MVKIFNFDDHPTQFSANTYVIGKVGGNCIVVDIGSTSDEIYHYIDKHYEKVVAVLLTHAHFDHIRGLTKLLKHYRNRYDIPVYLSEEVSLRSILAVAHICDSVAFCMKFSCEDILILPHGEDSCVIKSNSHSILRNYNTSPNLLTDSVSSFLNLGAASLAAA